MTEITSAHFSSNSAKPLILVVDDEAFMRTVIGDALGATGFGVVSLASGEELLEGLADMVPDAVVLDVVMPGLDGYATCQRLRAMPGCEFLPVLMVTGKDDLESIDRAFEAGATDFMAKPVNGPIMAHRLRYLLRSSLTAKNLRTSEQRLARAQKIARLSYWSYDPALEQFYFAEMAAELLGLVSGEGSYDPGNALQYLPIDVCEAFLSRLEMSAAGEELETSFLHLGQTSNTQRTLTASWDPKQPGETVISGTIQDVTELTSARQRIEYLAYYDELTGLANRALFLEKVREALAAAKRHNRLGALLYLDVHHFKRINDTFGLSHGDKLLKEIALRLRRFVRECDVLAHEQFEEGRVSRLGGDEFCILLSEISRPEDAAVVVERLDQAMREPFKVGQQTMHLTLRTGITVFPDHSDDPAVLLKQAYTALSFAKGASGAYQFYERSMTEAAVSRLNLEQEIRHGLERGDFILHYQPLINLKSQQIVGVEALARWQHPERGMISPGEFIPVAEDSGLIVPLGRQLLIESCRQGAAWIAAGHPPLRMSVNISPRQFIDDDICALLEQALEETGLPRELLEVEVTESLLLDGASQADETLQKIKQMGVGIAVDDFGTGYSSLSYLHAFPIDTLKIDRSFVVNGADGGQAQAILKAIVAMGKSLDLKILAEGVETEVQQQLLNVLGCDEAQGYLFGKPQSSGQIQSLFGERKAAG